MGLDKSNKKIIITMVIITAILGIFIDNASDIVFTLFMIYISYKYLINAYKNDTMDDNIEFIDKERYYKGLKTLGFIFMIYFIIRLLVVLTIGIKGFASMDLILIFIIYAMYLNRLGRKYIKCIDR